MGRRKLYQTSEEKAIANRAKSKKHYEKYRIGFPIFSDLFQLNGFQVQKYHQPKVTFHL